MGHMGTQDKLLEKETVRTPIQVSRIGNGDIVSGRVQLVTNLKYTVQMILQFALSHQIVGVC